MTEEDPISEFLKQQEGKPREKIAPELWLDEPISQGFMKRRNRVAEAGIALEGMNLGFVFDGNKFNEALKAAKTSIMQQYPEYEDYKLWHVLAFSSPATNPLQIDSPDGVCAAALERIIGSTEQTIMKFINENIVHPD